MVSFIETQLFTRLVQEYLADDDYQGLQRFLIEHPDAGKVVRGSGGVRKLRWRSSGQGTSGGFRVIYLAKLEKDVIWMLTIYPKNVKDNIPAHLLKQISKEVQDAE